MGWITEIERSFRERDPSLFFVLPRVLRRVLRHELEMTNPWMQVPHRKTFVIGRDRLLWLVAPDELGIESSAQVPDRALLIARPEDEGLNDFDRERLLRYYWRLIFHSRIDAVMWEKTSLRLMTPAEIRYRIDRLGQEQFDEIRSVLKQEHFLTHPQDLRNAYAEFVAVYSEFQAFAPELNRLYFPSLSDTQQVIALIREDCDTANLLEQTRPRDLKLPFISSLPAPSAESPGEATASVLSTERRTPPSRWRFRWLTRSAERLKGRGNVVRAAMQRLRAQRVAPPTATGDNQTALDQDLAELSRRLQAALKLDDAQTLRWKEMCGELLVHSIDGFWNANARLLYDLQKVCLDHERNLYRVDLGRWLRSFGRLPLRRPLPDLNLVLIAKHLSSAARRIGTVQIGTRHREELNHLLHHAADRAEELMRRMLEPQITESLLDSGLVPQSVVEQAAFGKLTAELVDGVVDRGFITLGHLRDAVSRGHLKLADLTGPREFFYGDALLRADRRLSVQVDGVYQRGPFYLRWLQRLSSLFFATPPGRFLTKYFVLPFGGAFVGLKGLEFMAEELHHFFDTPRLHFYSHELMFLVGFVLLGLIHWPAFRQGVWLVLRSSWLLTRGVLLDIPRFIYRLPGVALFLKSLPALLFRRYLFTPLLIALAFWKGLPALGTYEEPNPWFAIAVFVGSFLALNSRVGRDSEELFWEWLERIWHHIRVTIVIGLFNLVVDLFRQIMDAVERVLYTVDEWLRFRSGESNLSLAVKAVLGLVWGFVQGVIRFCVTLLIEPQINPIKHFPVVTVSHKLIFPLAFYLDDPISAFTDPITAKTIAVTIITCIPGIFGFLAWELKENWRAYAANRSPRLRPVLIGHHGETMLRLLKPGFHSGTIPKLFARRRRAARKAQYQWDRSKHKKYDEKLHHEAVAIQRFIERDFLGVLHLSQQFRDMKLTVSGVDLSTNRITVRIGLEDFAAPAKITFAEQSGWLVAGIPNSGWICQLNDDQKNVLSTALTGLYHQAAVDLVREQIEQELGHPTHPYDVAEGGLNVWPTRSYDSEIHYSLTERPHIVPRPRAAAKLANLNTVPASALIFTEHPLLWKDWQQYWEAEQRTEAFSDRLLEEVQLLRC